MDGGQYSMFEAADGVLSRSDNASGIICFGGFTAIPAARELFHEGKPVRLGGRAFDLLMLLLTSQGEVVSKEKIMRHVWPTTTVDDSNLRFQMAALRGALGEERERIKTITGRGYLFVAENDLDRSIAVLSDRRPHASVDHDPEDQPAIVIIERDPYVREALQRLLRPFDARVVSFGSFEAFVENGPLLQPCTE